MLLAKASIGRKLFFAFLAMALLVSLSALIGVFGFSFVAKTERNVVNSAIPAMIEARQVSELSSVIISSVQMLANAKSEEQRIAAGKTLFQQLESLLTHIKLLGSDSFESELLAKLETDVQRIINTLAELGIVVEKRLFIAEDLVQRTKEMRSLAKELEQLTRTQVANTSTVAVANVTHIYDLLDKQQTELAFNALDTLVEVDLDLAERLHELHLLAFKILNHIEEAQTVADIDRINTIRQEFKSNLIIMGRRVSAVEDPTRSVQMTDLLTKLERREVVFDVFTQRHQNELVAEQLAQNSLEQFSALNTTVGRLVDESNSATTRAVSKLKSTLEFAQLTLTVITILGIIIMVLIVWRVVYVSVLKRLAEYSSALLSIAQGQLKVDITVKGNDELAHMGQAIITARDTAHALKVVAESEVKAKKELQEHKEHLEELVTERTGQLQLANQKLNEEVENHAKARQSAEQASRAKSAFLATMSHEIRTPMNGVLGTTRLLKDAGLNSEQSHYVDVINRSGNTLLAILNDVLDYSKIEAGHLEIRPVDFNLHAMVQDTQQLLLAKAEEKGITLNYFIEDDVDKFWHGDVTRISQVLNNLVGNAVKFTEHGHVDIYVARDLDMERNILIEVSDTGVGIDEQEQSSLFEAFTQASGGINSAGGTGLGLAISKRIVTAMKGELCVESEVGHGSRFWFSIPLDAGNPVETVQPAVKSHINAKVLLVEDNPVNCLVAEGFLASMGHEVVTAINGKDALDVLSSQEFDLALLDINLPDCNGVELLERIKQYQRENSVSHTPLIAVSAHVYNEEVASYLAAGFDGYLPKPLDKDALCRTIQNKLEGKSLILPQLSNEERHEVKEMRAIIDPNIVENDMSVLGREKMSEIAQLFTSGSNQILEQLSKAVAVEDQSVIKQLTHKLKGSAGSMGMLALYDLCLVIEKAEQPLEVYQQHHVQLESLVKESIDALGDIID